MWLLNLRRKRYKKKTQRSKQDGRKLVLWGGFYEKRLEKQKLKFWKRISNMDISIAENKKRRIHSKFSFWDSQMNIGLTLGKMVQRISIIVPGTTLCRTRLVCSFKCHKVRTNIRDTKPQSEWGRKSHHDVSQWFLGS